MVAQAREGYAFSEYELRGIAPVSVLNKLACSHLEAQPTPSPTMRNLYGILVTLRAEAMAFWYRI